MADKNYTDPTAPQDLMMTLTEHVNSSLEKLEGDATPETIAEVLKDVAGILPRSPSTSSANSHSVPAWLSRTWSRS